MASLPLADTGLPFADVADLPSRHVELSAQEWARLAGSTPMALGQAELAALWSPPAPDLDLLETARAYLPLARLLHLHGVARQGLTAATEGLLGRPLTPSPLVVGLTGSVAVGKSTAARLLQALLEVGPGTPRVDLVTTDGFLHPNAELERTGLLARKGFPESYDVGLLLRFLADVKAGRDNVTAPFYSHDRYDIVHDCFQEVRRPDVVIIEGLNILSTSAAAEVAVSDFFDFTVYVDADDADIETWYVERFLHLCSTSFRNPSSYFHRYADLGHGDAAAVARGLWSSTNAPNLRENIRPSRARAHLILEKGPDHRVRTVRLRSF